MKISDVPSSNFSCMARSRTTCTIAHTIKLIACQFAWRGCKEMLGEAKLLMFSCHEQNIIHQKIYLFSYLSFRLIVIAQQSIIPINHNPPNILPLQQHSDHKKYSRISGHLDPGIWYIFYENENIIQAHLTEVYKLIWHMDCIAAKMMMIWQSTLERCGLQLKTSSRFEEE